ncbi:MAG: hypothetical protein II921_00345 [Treponema sp.]|nr:hypothetical protein [Treponema sp.]
MEKSSREAWADVLQNSRHNMGGPRRAAAGRALRTSAFAPFLRFASERAFARCSNPYRAHSPGRLTVVEFIVRSRRILTAREQSDGESTDSHR